MRKFWAPLAAVLLLGGASVVAAQEGEPDATGATEVTGTFVDVTFVDIESLDGSDKVDAGSYVETTFSDEWTMEWDDPRLPTTLRYDGASHEYRIPGTAAFASVEVGVAEGATDDGAWAGRARLVEGTDGFRFFSLMLEGSGAYEGLTAIVDAAWTGFSGWDVRGVIVPDMPEYDAGA